MSADSSSSVIFAFHSVNGFVAGVVVGLWKWTVIVAAVGLGELLEVATKSLLAVYVGQVDV